jgi:ribonuclease HI
MLLTIYTDGGSSGNPGPAASAFVLYKDTEVIFTHSEKIGIKTNNFAEYTALMLALKKVSQLLKEEEYKNTTEIKVFSDSELMVRQVNGIYKIPSFLKTRTQKKRSISSASSGNQ